MHWPGFKHNYNYLVALTILIYNQKDNKPSRYEAKDRQKCATSDWSKTVLLRLLKIDHKKVANHVLTNTNAGRHKSIVRSRDQFLILLRV